MTLHADARHKSRNYHFPAAIDFTFPRITADSDYIVSPYGYIAFLDGLGENIEHTGIFINHRRFLFFVAMRTKVFNISLSTLRSCISFAVSFNASDSLQTPLVHFFICTSS